MDRKSSVLSGSCWSGKEAPWVLVAGVNHNWLPVHAQPNADFIVTHHFRRAMCVFFSGKLNNAVIILLALSHEQMSAHLSRICSALSIERVARRKHGIITDLCTVNCLQMAKTRHSC